MRRHSKGHCRHRAWRKPFIKKKAVRNRLWRKQRGCCHYCGKYVRKDEATLEHVIPRSQGGLAYDPSNLVMACFECNNKKSVQDNPEWVRHQQQQRRIRERRRRRLGVAPLPYSSSSVPLCENHASNDSQSESPPATANFLAV